MRGARALIMTAMLAGSRAHAQDGGHDQDIDIELFRPYADAYGYFAVPSSATLKHLQIGGSLWVGYANDPMVLVFEGARTAPVNALVTGDDGDGIIDDRVHANAQVGIGLSRFFSFTVDVPLVLWQEGYDLNTVYNPTQEPTPLPLNGSGDVRLTPKVVALDLDRVPVGLAFFIPIGLPTAAGTGFLGEDVVTVTPSAVLEVADGSVRDGKYGFRLAGTAGLRARDAAEAGGISFSSKVFVYGVGLGIRPTDPFEILAELQGEVAGTEAAARPAEVNAGFKIMPSDVVTINAGAGFGVLSGVGAPDYRVFGGITVAPNLDPCVLDRDKDGVVNCEDQCMEEAEDDDDFRDQDGCPEDDNDNDDILDDDDQCPVDPEDHDGYRDRDGCPDPDNDKDTILDEDDQCPDDPEIVNDYLDEDGCPDDKPIEDTDGDGYKDDVDRCTVDPEDFDDFEDEDGCPEDDNDGDGFLDADDQCPLEREITNGVDDDDGCPDEGRVVLEASQIRILDKIYFEFNKAIIRPVSYSLLDEIAAVINLHPELLKIRIEGHTDDVGNDVYNLKLSQQRADAVRAALAERGVDPGRLDAVGFGEMRALDTNETEEGRAINRRVEFIIVDRQ